MTQIMKVRWVVGWVVVLMLVAAIGYAQEAPAAAAPTAPAAQELPARLLSLSEALDIARHNSPDYFSALNNRWGPAARERSSLLNMFTPSATLTAGTQHTNAGTQYFGTFPFAGPANSQNQWGLNLTYLLSGSTFTNRGQASADTRAADADVASALTALETTVRSQYLEQLRTIAQVDLAQRSQERARQGLALAQAKYQVGQGTLVDVRTNEYAVGQAEVNLLTAQQAVDNQTLALYQTLGVPAPEGVRIVPTDSFPVTPPSFSEAALIQTALDANPTLTSLRAQEASARWGTRGAISQYLPSFQATARWSGQTISTSGYYAPDSTGTLQYVPPKSVSGSNPLSLYVGFSVPLYDGFSRNNQIQAARTFEDDLRQQVRARELSVRTAVGTAYRGLLVAYQKIGIQARNKVATTEALDLAQQRYRVGSGTYLELLDAQVNADQADASYVTAVYDYHKAIATLENAVGRPLR